MAVHQIPYHIFEAMEQAFAAVKRNDTIVVVEAIWIRKEDAMKILGVKRREVLKWLADNEHIERRKLDKREYEYNPVNLERVAQLIKAGKIIIPTIREITNA